MPGKTSKPRFGEKITRPGLTDDGGKRPFNQGQARFPGGPDPAKGPTKGGRPPRFPGRLGGR